LGRDVGAAATEACTAARPGVIEIAQYFAGHGRGACQSWRSSCWFPAGTFRR